MVAEKKLWYKPLYCQLKNLGVKTDYIAFRLGISRTALRLWFNARILDEERAGRLADSLEDFAADVRAVAKKLRTGFKNETTN